MTKESETGTETKARRGYRRSINDLRAPLMLLYVAAFCTVRLGEAPAWIVIGGAAVAGAVAALLLERKLIGELLSWSVPGVLFGVGAAAVVYGLFAAALEVGFAATVGEGLVISGDAPPFLFAQLLAMKVAAAPLHPAVLGLGGAAVLGVGEEVFWRGFVQTRLMLMLPHVFATALAAVLYAGFWAVMLGPIAGVAAGVFGLVAGGLTLKLRSIVPSTICHVLSWICAIWLFPLL